jgi:hypothetical protein
LKAEDTQVKHKVHRDGLTSVDATDLVLVTTDAHLAIVADGPCPDKACQISIDTLHIEALPLSVWIKGSTRMVGLGVSDERWQALAVSSTRWVGVVVQLTALIQEGLELFHRIK